MFIFNGTWIDTRQPEPESAVWEEQEVTFVSELNVIEIANSGSGREVFSPVW